MEPEGAGRILLVSSGARAGACSEVLAATGHTLVTVLDLEVAAREMEISDHDVIVHAPDQAGVDEKRLIDWIRNLPEETPAVVVGIARGPLSRTLTFAGVREYLEAGRIESDLAAAASRALRYGRALRKLARLRSLEIASGRKPTLDRWLGASPRIQEALALASRLAGSRAPVVLLGERGTGKDIIGGLIHRESARVVTAPYVRCMVSALEPDRVHEELRGSTSRAGAFERALGGTLLLFGPEGVPPDVRPALADLVKKTRSGVKLLIACAPEHAGWVEEQFMPDPGSPAIALPALRERPEDLLVVAGTLIDHHSAAAGATPVVGATPAALAAMLRHTWPGNLRELDDTISRVVRRSAGPLLTADDLPELSGSEVAQDTGAPAAALALDVTRPLTDLGRQAARAAEILAIRRVLEITGGNVTHAARLLQVSRVHLQKRMKLYGLRSRE